MVEQEKELHRQYSQQFVAMANTLPDFNVTNFLAMQDLIENKDAHAYKNSLKSGSKYLLGGIAAGIVSNVTFTRLNPFNFLKRPAHVRYPLRFVIFVIPVSVAMYFITPHMIELENIHSKYNTRLERFRKTQDFNYMDPTGVLFKEFLEKTHNK